MSDPNSVAATFIAASTPVVQSAFESALKKIYLGIGKGTKVFRDRVVVNLRLGFEEYLHLSYTRCENFKTLLNPHEPLSIRDHYVNLNVECGERNLLDDQFIENFNDTKFAVITGLAGGGKSMFMKYATLKFFEASGGRVPLFVELRHLNALTNKNLTAFIRAHCTKTETKITEDQFAVALNVGTFILVLDGFDEINYDSRDDVQAEIFKIQREYPNTQIIVSSRPDDRFGSWSSFYVFKVCALSKPQCLKLIRSLDYKSGVKKRFLKEVSERLYASHTSFLSSPLLATIMLLTYEEFAEIPDRMHAFYNKAFDTLFQRHDAQKEQYKRKIRTGFTREEFRACFAAFCAFSYSAEKFSFSDDLLLSMADKALKYLRSTSTDTRAGVTAEQFVEDLRESVCVLQQDGIDTSFVHRSFQEYFCAVFVTSLQKDKIKRLLDKIVMRFRDSVIPMAFEMDRENIEQEWVLPIVSETISKFQFEAEIKLTATQMLKLMYSDIVFIWIDGAIFMASPAIENEITSVLDTLRRLYPKQINSKVPFVGLRKIFPHEFKELILREEHESQPGFKKFSSFFEKSKASLQEEKMKNVRQSPTLNVDLDEDDAWWIDALAIGQDFAELRRDLELVAKDIRQREKRRFNILEEFV